MVRAPEALKTHGLQELSRSLCSGPGDPACLTCACCFHSSFVKVTNNPALKGPQNLIVTQVLAGTCAQILHLQESKMGPLYWGLWSSTERGDLVILSVDALVPWPFLSNPASGCVA